MMDNNVISWLICKRKSSPFKVSIFSPMTCIFPLNAFGKGIEFNALKVSSCNAFEGDFSLSFKSL